MAIEGRFAAAAAPSAPISSFNPVPLLGRAFYSAIFRPAFDEMRRGPPSERLTRQGGITRPAGSHHGRAQDSQVRRFVRKSPTIDHVGLRVVAHARRATMRASRENDEEEFSFLIRPSVSKST